MWILEDVVEVFYRAIKNKTAGIFNIAADGTIPQYNLHKHLKKKHVEFSEKVLEPLLAALWKLRLSEINPRALDYIKYPIIISNQKLKTEFGYTPKYSTKETLERFASQSQ